MSGPVVVVGEALMDLVPDRVGRLVPAVGGGPFNTARAVARLGEPTIFIGRVSRDPYGQAITAALDSDGVALAPGLRCDLPTSLALAELDEAGRAAYRFYFEGTSAPALTPEGALALLPDDAWAVHVGGLGLVLEPMATAVEAVLAKAAGQAMIVVDPNVRPALIGDPAAYRGRLQRVMAQADVVKVSDEDLAFLDPGRAPLEAAARLLDVGPRLVLLTLGKQGAVAIGAFGTRTAEAPAVTVVDTIGAGDAFSGAWLARLRQIGGRLDDGAAALEATQFACRAAAYSCTRPGAAPPTAHELAAF